MTLIASLLFAVALVASIGVIALTIGNAMPRIRQVVEMEFAPAINTERRTVFGEIKGRKPLVVAQVISFPRKISPAADYRIAA